LYNKSPTLELVFTEEFQTKTEAMKREINVKGAKGRDEIWKINNVGIQSARGDGFLPKLRECSPLIYNIYIFIYNPITLFEKYQTRFAESI
jgi:hypothetical protein